MRRTPTWVLLGALAAALSGCGEDSDLCEGNCPRVEGAYAVSNTFVSGACDFVPLLLPPTLFLTQTPDGRQVSFEVIDPTNQLPVAMTVRLQARPDDNVATLTGSTEFVRQARRTSTRLVTMRTWLNATVTLRDGRRHVSGSLSTWSQPQDDEPGCQIQTAFMADSPPVL